MRLALCVLPSICAAALAQDVASAPQAAKPPAANCPITRSDLAQVYLRFEDAFHDHPPSGDRLIEVNKAFDAATERYLAGDYSAALRGFNAAAAAVAFGDSAPPAVRFASSLKVAVDPIAWPMRGPIDISVSQVLDESAAPGPVLRIATSGGEVMNSDVLGSMPFWSKYEFGLPITMKGDYMYRVQVLNADIPYNMVKVYAVYQTFDQSRAGLAARLDTVKPESREMEQALAACRSRVDLLRDTPSNAESAQFLPDLLVLRTEIEKEVSAIQMRNDPYRRRVGNYWRTVTIDGKQVACRVYAPAAAASTAESHPLLIALHGAGGDENLFLEGFGKELRQLADRYGLIVACPRTEALAADPAALDSVVDSIGLTYTIDPAKVYLLGHSSGAELAARLASLRSDNLAAVCCIAAFPQPASEASITPMLVITGAEDRIVASSDVQSRAKAAASAGQPVEVRIAEGYGHTLVVDHELTGAVQWLAAHSKAPPRP